MPLQFKVTAEIPAYKERIYKAWLDSKEHSAMTDSLATAGAKEGDEFTAFDDYAFGKNIKLVPFSKIIQSWRTTEFVDGEEDSVIEVIFEDKGKNTLITLTHTNLPPHGTTYQQGWIDYYFTPMQSYFSI